MNQRNIFQRLLVCFYYLGCRKFVANGILTITLCLLIASSAQAQGGAQGLSSLPEGAFTIAIIPDTQGYIGPGTRKERNGVDSITNPSFDAQTQFIVDNIDDQRIVFVSHVGDIVDRRKNPGEWKIAKAHMARLNGRVPYGIALGNHDMGMDGDASEFQAEFPASAFGAYSWYGGTFTSMSPEAEKLYGNNVNSYQLFSVDGIDFVFLHLECNAPDEVLEWADGILTRYGDRVALVSTHMYLGAVKKPSKKHDGTAPEIGRMEWSKQHRELGNNAVQLWDKLFRKHENIVAIFSGDQGSVITAYEERKGDAGNTVHAFLSDYAWKPILRLYRFIPAEEKIQVVTYDVKSKKLIEQAKLRTQVEDHQFEVKWVANKAASKRAN